MADEPSDRTRINPGYVLGQLARALTSAGDGAVTRVRQWRDVLSGLASGALDVGSRVPVRNTPAWATLEVVHGGFATGGLAAGGPLLLHETERLRALAPEQMAGRTPLNLYFVSDAGRSELLERLLDGRFRIRVPEEGALLAATWLLDRGEAGRAEELIGTLIPFFDRLRFYPVPHDQPLRSGAGVYLQTVGQSVASLRRVRPKAQVERMKEAINIWAPLYDRAVALFLETVEGDTPSLRTDETGKIVQNAAHQPHVEGGWPCRRFPGDWQARAQALLDEHRTARERHRLCGKPERRKENFARLREYMAACVRDSAVLTTSDLKMLRQVLASYVTRRGIPGGEPLAKARAEQSRNGARPGHHAVAQLIAERLEPLPQDEGATEIDSLLVPLTAAEAARIQAHLGVAVPRPVAAKAERCREAPIASLLERRLIVSSETMARVVPALTAEARANAIEDVRLRRLYESIYRAFRRRRSLLLLNLTSQVRLGELPWVAAVEPWIGDDAASRKTAHVVLVQVVTLSIETFPHTITPNKLVKELRALASAAGKAMPLVDELAADIFMGAFSEAYLRAAQVAGHLLKGTLYERYFGISYDRILVLNDLAGKYGVATSPGFLAICEEGAPSGETRSWSPARNGTIIEQAQILTTHNLAVLWSDPEVAGTMRPKLPMLARRCFEWICARQQLTIRHWPAQLRTMKNSAYAWRQMIFYLALAHGEAVAEFLEWSGEHLSRQRPDFQQRFAPVMVGLRESVAGRPSGVGGIDPVSRGRRWLGWTVGRHWLFPPSEKASG
jgi:hypothetical protein